MAFARARVVVMRPWRITSVVKDLIKALRWSAGSDSWGVLHLCRIMLSDETPDNTVERPEIWDKAGAGRNAYAEESAAADSAKKAYTLDILLLGGHNTRETRRPP